ncbi:hypothetical protein GA0115243_10881, partial [Streptomyces sp. ScaeMP-e83]
PPAPARRPTPSDGLPPRPPPTRPLGGGARRGLILVRTARPGRGALPKTREGAASRRTGLATLDGMDYVSALVPPVVMAIFFIGLVVTIVKSQGGPNKAKEDEAVDAAIARAESVKQTARPENA